ncbi:cytochrome bd oxidase small subunit CydS [Mesobacillus zeae]
MQDFLIMYAPQLVVLASIIAVFVWGTKSSFFEKLE